jgi:hypothetical protein
MRQVRLELKQRYRWSIAIVLLLTSCVRANPIERLRPYAAPGIAASVSSGRPPALATLAMRPGCEELRLSSDAGSMTDGPFPLIRMIRCDGRVAGEVWIRTVWRAAREPAATRAHENAAGCFLDKNGDVNCFVRTHAGTEREWRRALAVADSVSAWTLPFQSKCRDEGIRTMCTQVADGGNVVVETRRGNEYRSHTYDAPSSYPYAANPRAAELVRTLYSVANRWPEPIR